MEEDLKIRGEASPRLLDLIRNEKDWMLGDAGGGGKGLKASQEKDLELRLGPPGGIGGAEEEQSSVLSLGFFSKASKTTTAANRCTGAKRGFFNSAAETTRNDLQQLLLLQQHGGFVQAQSKADLGKETAQRTSGTTVKAYQHGLERKASHVAPGSTVGSNSSSQTRTASVPVVGWPPIRSFRKNLASTSTKTPVESTNVSLEKRDNIENGKKCLFLKINMDGIPIGRKVNLNAYDSYEKLSSAVEGLFQGLLEAQKDPSANDAQKTDGQVFTGLLDGTGEYTLVYEDTEGDKMLVGDVPWDMFVSTAKRLRVLKSSDLSALRLGSVCRKRAATEC